MCRGAEKRRRRALVRRYADRGEPLTFPAQALAAAGVVLIVVYAVAGVCWLLAHAVLALFGWHE